MKLLAIIRQLRVVVPRDDDANSVVRIEVEALEHPKMWGIIPLHVETRIGESLTAGECVTVGMVLLSQGVANQEPGTLAHSYAVSALTNLRETLDDQIARAKALAEFTKEHR